MSLSNLPFFDTRGLLEPENHSLREHAVTRAEARGLVASDQAPVSDCPARLPDDAAPPQPQAPPARAEGEEPDALTRAAKLRLGMVLGDRWRLDTLLGVGGMAAVYAATHRNGHQVAIKLLHSHFLRHDWVRAGLVREGYVANMIGHSGAVPVMDDGVADDGSPFLVMQLLRGETLRARVARSGGRLPEREALHTAFILLDVLVTAHAAGVVHRDVKPENVFITREGELKVLDFGIARLTHAGEETARFRTGAPTGTPGFMSPEQALARSEEIDAQTDIWSVGATLFVMLTGRAVHAHASSPNEHIIYAATTPAPALSSVYPGVDPRVAEVVDRALSFEKSERWQSAKAMQDAIEAILMSSHGDCSLAGGCEASPSEQGVVAAPPARRRRLSRFVQLAAAAALGIPLAVAAIRHRAPGPIAPLAAVEASSTALEAEHHVDPAPPADEHAAAAPAPETTSRPSSSTKSGASQRKRAARAPAAPARLAIQDRAELHPRVQIVDRW
jgi:eukaryotic-like serine/threonine-protein kinase